jgi:hypothetical protein
MKTPWYETSSGALQTLLATRQFVYGDLYTLSLTDGTTVLRFATCDMDVVIQGNTWGHKGPFFDKASSKTHARWAVGTGTDTWNVDVIPRQVDPVTLSLNPDTINGTPWLQAIKNGVLDNAVMQVDRFYAASWPIYGQPVQVTGAITLFKGLVGDVAWGRDLISIQGLSYMTLLSLQMPRNTYQVTCRHNLFDIGCTLSAASYAVNGIIASVVAPNQFTSTAAAPPGSGTYALGNIKFTSGANAGQSRTIRSWDSSTGTFTLVSPFPNPIAVGDAFTAYSGCDKQFSTCSLFNNTANYGGQPYIPDATTAI